MNLTGSIALVHPTSLDTQHIYIPIAYLTGRDAWTQTPVCTACAQFLTGKVVVGPHPSDSAGWLPQPCPAGSPDPGVSSLHPCNIRHLPLDCHCNQGVNRQYWGVIDGKRLLTPAATLAYSSFSAMACIDSSVLGPSACAHGCGSLTPASCAYPERFPPTPL